MPKFTDYQPVFFEGQSVWIQDTPSQLSQPTPLQQVRNTNQANATHPFTVLDEGQRVTSAASHVCQTDPIEYKLNISFILYRNQT